MMLTKLNDINNKVIGTKQTLKALKNQRVLQLFVAQDAEPKVINPIIDLANKHQVSIIYANSMNELGLAANIEVGAAVVAVLKS